MNEQYRILAEWMGYYVGRLMDGRKCVEYFYKKNKASSVIIDWQPDKDANQRDMLEAKMIEELEINNVEFNKVDDGWDAIYYLTGDAITVWGKTIPEAKYNAIYKYAKESMK
jgi:hypothetical protein